MSEKMIKPLEIYYNRQQEIEKLMSEPMSKITAKLDKMPAEDRAYAIYFSAIKLRKHLPHKYTVNFAAEYYEQHGNKEKAEALRETDKKHSRI